MGWKREGAENWPGRSKIDGLTQTDPTEIDSASETRYLRANQNRHLSPTQTDFRLVDVKNRGFTQNDILKYRRIIL